MIERLPGHIGGGSGVGGTHVSGKDIKNSARER